MPWIASSTMRRLRRVSISLDPDAPSASRSISTTFTSAGMLDRQRTARRWEASREGRKAGQNDVKAAGDRIKVREERYRAIDAEAGGKIDALRSARIFVIKRRG